MAQFSLTFAPSIIGNMKYHGEYLGIDWLLAGGVLTLRVTGESYCTHDCVVPVPWRDHRVEIRALRFRGVLRVIGLNWFSGCINLLEVRLPAGVREIRGGAFRGCVNLRSVTLPADLEWIGSEAFMGCSELYSIDLPNGLCGIYRDAFRDCISLLRIELPMSLRRFGSCGPDDGLGPFSDIFGDCDVFLGCKKLKSITVHRFNELICAVDGVLFSRDHTHLLVYPEGCPSAIYRVPSGVTSVTCHAFNHNLHLCELYFPSSLTYLPGDALTGCTALELVELSGTALSRTGPKVFAGSMCAIRRLSNNN